MCKYIFNYKMQCKSQVWKVIFPICMSWYTIYSVGTYQYNSIRLWRFSVIQVTVIQEKSSYSGLASVFRMYWHHWVVWWGNGSLLCLGPPCIFPYLPLTAGRMVMFQSLFSDTTAFPSWMERRAKKAICCWHLASGDSNDSDNCQEVEWVVC